MARYIAAAPGNDFSVEEITHGQSYPAPEVAKYLNGDIGHSEGAIQLLESEVDTSDVIRDGQSNGTLYV